MKAGWQTEKLGEVCSLLNRGISPKYIDVSGICVLNQKCIRDHRVSYEQARRHDLAAKSVSENRFIQLGDVLVNSTGTGTLGRVAQVRDAPEEPTTVDSHVTIVRPKQGKFYQDFFGYMLILIEEAIKEAGEGCGGQTELARSVLAEKFSVSYPTSIVEQQRIVTILDQAFEGIAKARANAEQNLQNARALFESHLQSIFANGGMSWEVKTLNQIAENLDNKRVPITKNVRSNGAYPYYGASGIVDYVGEFIFDGDLLLVSEDGANLLARTYPIAFSIHGKTWVNNHAHVLRFKEITTQKLVEFYLNSIPLNDFVSGMAQPKLNQKMLNTIPIPFPPLAEREVIVAKFDELSAETQRLEALYQRKIALLDELKKSLLQQVFTGEL